MLISKRIGNSKDNYVEQIEAFCNYKRVNSTKYIVMLINDNKSASAHL